MTAHIRAKNCKDFHPTNMLGACGLKLSNANAVYYLTNIYSFIEF
jgi:hypothetical protein